jgi:hypothetical protein
MLAEYWASDGKSEAFTLHQRRIYDYLWLAEDGMKMQVRQKFPFVALSESTGLHWLAIMGHCLFTSGNYGIWLQCLLPCIADAVGLADEMPAVRRACQLGYQYIDITQVRENNRDREEYYRHISKGAWPFSTVDHGHLIDCCRSRLTLPFRLAHQRLHSRGFPVRPQDAEAH